jgi:hypothetical protein
MAVVLRLRAGIGPVIFTATQQVILLLIFVSISIYVNGCLFGGMDHAIHFPLIERAHTHDFLVGDPLVDIAQHHPSVLWEIIASFLNIASLEGVYFSLYIVSIAAIFCGTAALARAI